MTMNTMKRWFMAPFQMSMRYKLMILMVIVAILPLTTVTFFAAQTTKQSLSSEIIRSNESRMNWAAQYFDEKFSQLHSVAYSLLLDNNIFPTSGRENEGDIKGPNMGNFDIEEKLRSLYVANNNNIVRISLYLNEKQRLYVVDKDAVRFTDNLDTSIGNWGEIAKTNQSVNKVVNVPPNTFILARSMNRFENLQVLGGVLLEVRWKMMNNVMDMIHSEANSEVLIVDAQGNTMYNPYGAKASMDPETLKKAIGDSAEPGHVQLKQGILFFQPAVSGQIWIVKFVPMSYVTESAATTLSFSFYTAVASILAAILLSVLIAYFTTKPIIRLTKSMKAVEHQNFNVGLDNIRSDEIGTLERRFNSMLQRIKELIQIEYKSKIETRTAQIKAMQAQINPHFLYNSLQAIGGVAIDRKVPEIYDYLRAISDLFRYTIKMQSELVTIFDEMEHVSNYLHIQKLRFQDMLEFELDVEEGCEDYCITKFTLQPIVENCFVHGLEGMMKRGRVLIKIERVVDEIEISIEDNGVGIEPERLEDIQRQLETNDELLLGESMGINNVNSRIRLIFGEEFGLFVASVEGDGTTVKVIIPAIRRGEELLQ
ncbi:hypothetical protein BC351_24495 [Paenibacillus ferrarius]|uniref:histidine kinase n=1 Tax=Paenibacillus ferrarius TaxID=1469647 RepID=A0A1V4HLL2_9BACL|nr:sensor histidine kinase [Paenibacillus ferrarius]OPH58107.1 hypothetical protein BC351_24495 [Paenibacillus ferrarius]